MLESYLRLTEKALFKRLLKSFKATYCKDNYILVQGEAPVLLVAHLDTVHNEPVKVICTDPTGDILMSPQGIGGDDRCGVYGIIKVYEEAKVKPWLLFTCKEEIGGIGAHAFCGHYEKGLLPDSLRDLKCIIELDRKGKNDAVFYDCANKEFEKFITANGFKTAIGSFSDISVIAPALGVAAVNLSCGYYNAHTQHEYIVLPELRKTINRVKCFVAEAAKDDFPQYKYVEREYFRKGWLGEDLDEFWDDPEIPKDVPNSIKREYLALLDFYPPQELEKYWRECGEWAIRQLYMDEIGFDFAEAL